jgi:glycosyltransferase involved in cell wall biosynthesis
MIGEKKPRRVLHVLGQLNPGGVETWLLAVASRLDRSRAQFDFCVHKADEGFFDEQIRSLGCEIIPCTTSRNSPAYARDLYHILRDRGPYDAVHSHVHHFSGVVLSVAAAARIPIRIAHSHNDTRTVQRAAPFHRRAYFAAMRTAVRASSTHGLACSSLAATALMGPRWNDDSRWRVLLYGIDCDLFRIDDDPTAVRAELGFAPDETVVGHVGSFTEQKNHPYLIDVCARIASSDPKARFLLVGDGPLRPDIEKLAADKGLGDRIVFAGLRRDVPRLMRCAMDVFVFPSLFEGLGLVSVEAQAAGVPVVCADTVPDEADLLSHLVTRLSLDVEPSVWAEQTLAVADRHKGSNREDARQAVSDSEFSLDATVAALTEIYCS